MSLEDYPGQINVYLFNQFMHRTDGMRIEGLGSERSSSGGLMRIHCTACVQTVYVHVNKHYTV